MQSQSQSNVPYQAYRSKRHARNVSNNSQQFVPNVEPPPTSRPPSVYTPNGHTNGHTHAHNLSDSAVTLQRDFAVSEKEKYAENGLVDGHLVADGVHGPTRIVVPQSRRPLSMSDMLPVSDPQEKILPSQPTSPPLPAVTLAVSTPRSPSPPLPAPPADHDSPESNSSTPLSTSPSIPASAASPAASATHKPEVEAPPLSLDTVSAAGPSSLASSSSSAPSGSAQTSPAPSPRPPLSALAGSSRKASTFRRVLPRTASAKPNPGSPLRPQANNAHIGSSLALPSPTRVLHPLPARTPESASRAVSPLAAPSPLPNERALPALPSSDGVSSHAHLSSHHQPHRISTLNTFTTSPMQSPIRTSSAPPPTHAPAPAISPTPSSSSAVSAPSHRATTPGSASHTGTSVSRTPTRTPAPYRPGFQPKGVYRPRTDEFLEARKGRSDVGRVEKTRLERRLEKLIQLHFPHPDSQRAKEKEREAVGRPGAGQNRRASSFFDMDFSSIRGKSAGDLWKGVVQSQAGGKGDIRASEQKITPWEEDAAVSQCPCCSASFHPLTNRKHHCRLCGRIVCSLPQKYPQRPQPCSLLFIADPITGQVEEVDEGVDYGVRKRTVSTNTGGTVGGRKGKVREDSLGLNDNEKFLKGVRICKDCRPVILRRRYTQEAHNIPLFSRLYEAFILIEKEIEEMLPQFQELMISLSHEERPAPEASAVRKRLLEAFAQYDALAKRIRKIPCQGGPGSSQDRVQQAIVTRANLFLQKHMFPLQALPKPRKPSTEMPSPSGTPEGNTQLIDPDSEVARVLQPLLEQEALLESFVEEAKAHRKFEDAQTLKANLSEIRAEIDRILANAEVRPGGGNTRR